MSAYHNVRTIAGDEDTINALIMAAALNNCWSQVQRTVLLCRWSPDIVAMYRQVGATTDELIAWNKIVEISRNFEVRYVE